MYRFTLSADYSEAKQNLQNTSSADSTYATRKTEFENVENSLLNLVSKNYDIVVQIYIFLGIFLAYPLRSLFQIFFAWKRGRRWNSIYGECILSLLHFLLSVISVTRFVFIYRYKQGESPRYDRMAILLSAFDEEEFLSLYYVYGLFIMIQWMRIVLIFKLNSFISPMLSIIQNMLKDISKFCVIYLFIVLVFWASGKILFSLTPGYDSEFETFKTLFASSFGSFNFKIFSSDKNLLTKSHGNWFLMSYLIISNIVLLNFIIAVISNTYTNLRSVSNSLYLNEIIKARNIFEYDKYYSGLVSLPPPLNFLLILVFPFYCCIKSERLNNFVLHVSYLPVMVIGTSVFIASSIIMYPISYIALLYQNFIDIWEKGNNGSSKCAEASQFFTMIFKAPFILLCSIFVDTAKFITSLYTSRIRVDNERSAEDKYNFKNLD